MNKRIIYPTDDGGVAVIIPAPEARRQVQESETVTRDETDDEFIAWIAAKDVPAGKPFKIVDVSDIPEDRTFRAAWEYTA
jgi:hypothetical protein